MPIEVTVQSSPDVTVQIIASPTVTVQPIAPAPVAVTVNETSMAVQILPAGPVVTVEIDV